MKQKPICIIVDESEISLDVFEKVLKYIRMANLKADVIYIFRSRVINKVKEVINPDEELIMVKNVEKIPEKVSKYELVFVPEHLKDVIKSLEKVGVQYEVISSDKIPRVKDFMTKNIITVGPDETIQEVATLMRQHEISSIIVMSKGKPIGIITLGDIMRRIVLPARDPRKTTAEEIMSFPLIAINENKSIIDAAEEMKKRGIKRLVVVNDNNDVTGIITQTDILNFLYKVSENKEKILMPVRRY